MKTIKLLFKEYHTEIIILLIFITYNIFIRQNNIYEIILYITFSIFTSRLYKCCKQKKDETPNIKDIIKKYNLPEIVKNNKNQYSIIHIMQNINQYIKHNNTEEILYQMQRFSKIVLIIIGDNGTGKTNLIWQLSNYFNQYHAVIVANLDNYKQNYNNFIDHAKKYNTLFMYPIISSKKEKYILEKYINDFLMTQSTMMIVDTSGRNHNNDSLTREINNIIHYNKEKFKQHNIQIKVIYNFSGIKIAQDIDQFYFDYISISQLNKKYNNLNLIYKIASKYQLLFLSYGININSIEIYSNSMLANLIFTTIKENKI